MYKKILLLIGIIFVNNCCLADINNETIIKDANETEIPKIKQEEYFNDFSGFKIYTVDTYKPSENKKNEMKKFTTTTKRHGNKYTTISITKKQNEQ